MNDRVIGTNGTNVYYLPGPMEPDAPRADLQPRLSKRLRHAWWRLRLALSEMRAILFHPRRRFTADDYAALLEPETDAPPLPRPARPARVIDFDAARQRLRPASQA